MVTTILNLQIKYGSCYIIVAYKYYTIIFRRYIPKILLFLILFAGLSLLIFFAVIVFPSLRKSLLNPGGYLIIGEISLRTVLSTPQVFVSVD